MKKIFTFLLITFTINSFSQNDNAILGINFGMTKNEIIKEFKSNKEEYTKIDLGGFLWRYYYQNNSYDKKGGLTLLQLTPVGGGLYGLNEANARMVFNSLIRLLAARGYEKDSTNTKSINYFEFKIGETYIMSSKKLGKNIYIGLPPSSGGVYLNLVIGKYIDMKNQGFSNSKL